ncbi:putative membrane protein insertion efficiency factor [Aeromicrobium panaciterrae]|uniref:Putative membrane protein insertion efficiency factor n=1 Tax=Aeromicrobium panaciterrae TaxID=363861 RepID=A0ABU1UK26_9ACTN|nr:membrane protein insertion efficiency factor YidD [Aeromicrobium panaciterrae]MDR7085519.1 putative membrane protein insertion efficiency factor [Aeromicrobium panaciterrae]
MKYPIIWFLKAYRFAISPLYGQVCRYHPTCSAYALQAVETHGAIRGVYLAARRVMRCHPWAAGGYDPVPQTHSLKNVNQHRGEQCSAS